jgi:hypothetical protein
VLWWLFVATFLATALWGCKPQYDAVAGRTGEPEEDEAFVPCPEGGTELTYRLQDTFASGMGGRHGLALGPTGELYVAGDAGIKVLTAGGELLREWRTRGPATCVGVDDEGSVYVGLRTVIIKFSTRGEETDRWEYEGRGPGRFRFITGMAMSGVNVFVADAGNRCIHRFAVNGDFICAIGERDPTEGSPGLICPSPYLDCAVSPPDRLHVTNPGRLRVETYDFNGNLIRLWGQAGLKPHQFVGCCNPTNLAILENGRFVTAEKEAPRVKVYSPQSELLACMGPNQFSPEAEGLDLAADADGRIYVAESGSGAIHVFAPADAISVEGGETDR